MYSNFQGICPLSSDTPPPSAHNLWGQKKIINISFEPVLRVGGTIQNNCFNKKVLGHAEYFSIFFSGRGVDPQP